MRWVKLWTQETLYGTTNRELTLEERAIWFEMLALAGDSPVPGIICVSPDVSFTDAQLSQILDAPLDLIERTKVKLASPEIGKITVNSNGFIHIRNWDRYQSDFDRASYQREYMRDYRKRKTNTCKTNTCKTLEQTRSEQKKREVIAPPTPPKAATTSFEQDELWAIVAALYQKNIGLMPPILADRIKDFLAQNDIPKEWLADAFAEAVSHNARKWVYIEKVLETWMTEGRNGGRKGVDASWKRSKRFVDDLHKRRRTQAASEENGPATKT